MQRLSAAGLRCAVAASNKREAAPLPEAPQVDAGTAHLHFPLQAGSQGPPCSSAWSQRPRAPRYACSAAPARAPSQTCTVLRCAQRAACRARAATRRAHVVDTARACPARTTPGAVPCRAPTNPEKLVLPPWALPGQSGPRDCAAQLLRLAASCACVCGRRRRPLQALCTVLLLLGAVSSAGEPPAPALHMLLSDGATCCAVLALRLRDAGVSGGSDC
jgi:hypothetical protein